MTNAIMKVASVVSLGQIMITEKPIPACPPDSMLVQVESCAICGSDLRIYKKGDARARYPIVIGHEIAGTIRELGREVWGYQVGERVCIAPGHGCGECKYCLSGHSNVCIHPRPSIGYASDGGFAQYMVPPANVVKLGFVNAIPDGLSFDHASLSEIIACCLNAQENCPVNQGDVVLIIGAGPAGCVHAILSKMKGAEKVLMTQRTLPRLQMASERLQVIDRIIASEKENLNEVVKGETGGLGADVIYVCAPSPEAQAQAFDLAAPRGRINFFGGLPKEHSFLTLNANTIHYLELFISGASSSLARQNREALELLASGQIDAEGIITHRFPLEDISRGLRVVEDRTGIKVVIKPHLSSKEPG
ncbi:MAG: alcohol dehydrogenase catalytic domain-containing protein [Candidatus Atribacteria bacterium]|nr:alcohol dehydrogenase catalytic domain-containing protein [Candidatus Atribacteria bacterium]